MSDAQMLARIDENVRYLRKSFDEHKEKFEEHVADDKSIAKDFIRPLWEESQQRKGAAKLAVVIYAGVSAVVAAGVTWFAGGHK